jgi:hypothetical protein
MAIEPDYTMEGGVWAEKSQQWDWHDDQGQRHRVGGPAYIHADGSQYWYLHGRLHRLDGPAVTYPNGTLVWYVHGELHRADGPAIIHSTGCQSWYVQGRNITREVQPWMAVQGITLPFTEEQLVEFQLRWL